MSPKFLPDFERNEPEVRDPTAMREWKTCKRKYFFKMVLGLRDKTVNYPMSFGIAYHRFREILSKTGELKPALDSALKEWPGDPAVGAKFDFLTQARLVKSCMVAYNHVKKEKEKGQIQTLVAEQAFSLRLGDSPYYRGGRLDEGVLYMRRPWARDYKASSKTPAWWERAIDPNDQFSTYSWGFSGLSNQLSQGTLVEVMFNTKKEGPKIFTKMATRSPKQIERWVQEQIFHEKLIDMCREADIWPMEESQCPFCEFRSVCKSPTEASMTSRIKQFFIQKFWDFRKVSD